MVDLPLIGNTTTLRNNISLNVSCKKWKVVQATKYSVYVRYTVNISKTQQKGLYYLFSSLRLAGMVTTLVIIQN